MVGRKKKKLKYVFFLFPLYFLPTLTRSIQKGFNNDFSTRKPV